MCDSCKRDACHVILDYKSKGLWLGAPIWGHITSRKYYLVCDACEQERLLLPQEKYLVYEKQLVPWLERDGLRALAIIFLLTLLFMAGIFVVAFIDFMLSAG